MKPFRLVTQWAAPLVLVLSVAAAQQKPDFSGTWVAVSPAEAVGQEEIIKQDGTTFRRWHASEGDGHSFIYKLDGSENRIVMPSHGEEIIILAKASWDGDRLLIVEAVTYPDGRKNNGKTVYSLDSSGQLVVEHTRGGAGNEAKSTKEIYKKK